MTGDIPKSSTFNRREVIEKVYAKTTPLACASFLIYGVVGIARRRERVFYHSLIAATSTIIVAGTYFGTQESLYQGDRIYKLSGNMIAGGVTGTLVSLNRNELDFSH
jgi:hypothetical protein